MKKFVRHSEGIVNVGRKGNPPQKGNRRPEIKALRSKVIEKIFARRLTHEGMSRLVSTKSRKLKIGPEKPNPNRNGLMQQARKLSLKHVGGIGKSYKGTKLGRAREDCEPCNRGTVEQLVIEVE